MNAIISGSSVAMFNDNSHQLKVSGNLRREMEQPQPFLTENELPDSMFGFTEIEMGLSDTYELLPAITLPFSSSLVILTIQAPKQTPQLKAISDPPFGSRRPVHQDRRLECGVPEGEDVTLGPERHHVVRAVEGFLDVRHHERPQVNLHRPRREDPVLVAPGVASQGVSTPW